MNSVNQRKRLRRRRKSNSIGRNSVITTILTAVVGTVINDLSSEKSVIKQLFRIKKTPEIDQQDEQKQILNADFSVLETRSEKPKEIEV